MSEKNVMGARQRGAHCEEGVRKQEKTNTRKDTTGSDRNGKAIH